MRRPVALAGCLVASLLVLVLLVFPTALLGVRPGPLSQSTGATGFAECREDAGEWVCPVWASELSGTVGYRVEVDFFGCWDAERAGGEEERLPPQHKSGCVTSLDYVASFIF